jgi:hypothetical protein
MPRFVHCGCIADGRTTESVSAQAPRTTTVFPQRLRSVVPPHSFAAMTIRTEDCIGWGSAAITGSRHGP